MKGFFYAFIGGACITFQSVANSTISRDIGTWQAPTITQFTGFIVALLIFMVVRDGKISDFKNVKPLYLVSGAFAALIISGEVTAIHHIGVTLSVAILLIAQLLLTFLVDLFGWFGIERKPMHVPQFLGIGLMILGVIILKM
ncbi:DMT family transporter [Sporolactobacillus kofuensis]|uniref:DMT family transporter n=1 Tax=Sporolactobacillus kofuensis TaxID=269672 RepID=A0ABW1WB64_9BACL|nr:DMT family transporter [Sporolactobacillus kofuensis]MCO7174973.1 DMT family transporter [Sporolactobacillus kofuensis]